MSDGTAQSSTSPDPPTGALQGLEAPPKKKQKRNKPTLSCEECVERKTKVSTAFAPPRLRCASRATPDTAVVAATAKLSVVRPDQAAVPRLYQAAVDMQVL
jgi:hypothetical protein